MSIVRLLSQECVIAQKFDSVYQTHVRVWPGDETKNSLVSKTYLVKLQQHSDISIYVNGSSKFQILMIFIESGAN